MAFQKTMAMNSPVDSGAAAPGGFGSSPGSAPGAGGFTPPATGAAPASGFGAPPPGASPAPGFAGPTAQATPPPKKKKTGLFIGLGCVALLLFGCIGTGGYLYWRAQQAVEDVQDAFDEAVEDANAANEAVEEAGNAAGGAAAAGGGDLCARAADCCEAYVEAMGTGSADQMCAGMRTAGVPESSCQTSIDGYRTGLQAMNKTVPSACQ